MPLVSVTRENRGEGLVFDWQAFASPLLGTHPISLCELLPTGSTDSLPTVPQRR